MTITEILTVLFFGAVMYFSYKVIRFSYKHERKHEPDSSAD